MSTDFVLPATDEAFASDFLLSRWLMSDDLPAFEKHYSIASEYQSIIDGKGYGEKYKIYSKA